MSIVCNSVKHLYLTTLNICMLKFQNSKKLYSEIPKIGQMLELDPEKSLHF